MGIDVVMTSSTPSLPISLVVSEHPSTTDTTEQGLGQVESDDQGRNR